MFGPLLDVQMSFYLAGARDCAPVQNQKNVRVLSQFQLQPPLHYTPLHYYNYNYTTLNYTTLITFLYATLIALHYYITPHHTTLHSTTPHHTTLHCTTPHYTSLHYTTLTITTTTITTLHCTTLHNTTTTTTTPPRYSCITPHYIQQLWVKWPTRWPLQPLQPLQKTQLQPPFSPSVDSLCHPWFTTTKLSYRFPILKLPPPPCAALLVFYQSIELSVFFHGAGKWWQSMPWSNLNVCRMFSRLFLNLQEHVASVHPFRKHLRPTASPGKMFRFFVIFAASNPLEFDVQKVAEMWAGFLWGLRVWALGPPLRLSVVQLLPAFRQAAMLQRVPRILVEKMRYARSIKKHATDIAQQSEEALVGEPCHWCCFRNGTLAKVQYTCRSIKALFQANYIYMMCYILQRKSWSSVQYLFNFYSGVHHKTSIQVSARCRLGPPITKKLITHGSVVAASPPVLYRVSDR